MRWVLTNWRWTALGAAFVVLLSGAWTIYGKGESAGKADIKSALQTETIRTLDDGRISKEKTDEEVVRTPYDGRVDGLR